MSYKIFVFLILALFVCQSCDNEAVYVPKPRMYPKVNYPAKKYQKFDADFCKMTFEYPVYADFTQDKYFFEEKPIDPCWFDIDFPDFNGALHCSYIPVQNRKHYDKLIEDSFRMVEEHNSKANFRKEERIMNQHGVGGLYFSLGGEVATNMQFILTDTTEHFFRASLYFNAKVAPDSIRPIYQFVKEDVDKMLETFQWN
ncbi:hypothetical protein N9B82_04425 [Saprospiraceae bacterium]|nr:hypothetical protein [Saprospiraceae bacterium]